MNYKRALRWVSTIVVLVMVGAGCGGDDNHFVPPPLPGLSPTGSTGLSIDCKKNLAFVALDFLDSSTGNGQVAVLNTAVNPNTTDPRVGTIDLGHPDFPVGVAVDPVHQQVFVVSGDNGNGGWLDIIDTSTSPPHLVTGGSLPAPFPTGSDTGSLGQVIYDPTRNKAIISVVDDSSCPSSGTCTGFLVADLASKTFEPLIVSLVNTDVVAEADSFAFNPVTNVAVAPSDDLDPPLLTADIGGGEACTLDDTNIDLQSDSDGASFDPTTNIVVIGDYSGTMATVVNLNGSSFSGTPPTCTLDEGGTPPNSVNIDLGADDPGVAVNPVTHEAFMTGEDTNDVALVSLPTASVSQIDDTMVSEVHSTLPNDPDDSSFDAEAFPFYTTVDVCNNLGYVTNSSFSWLAQVDLAALKSNPSAISTALPGGSCAGTGTSFACDNGNGVKFFPLPAAPVTAAGAALRPNASSATKAR